MKIKVNKLTWLVLQQSPEAMEDKLLQLFNGLDGFGQIIFFWLFTCLQLATIVLVVIGFANENYWALAGGVLACRSYLYLTRIGKDLIDKMAPYDG